MKNDTWNILGITANRYDQAIITIYNRWGEEVYKTYGEEVSLRLGMEQKMVMNYLLALIIT